MTDTLAAPDAHQPTIRLAAVASLRRMLLPGGRDCRLLDRQVMLTLATKDRLYTDVTAVAPLHPPGMRIELERALAGLLAGTRPGLASATALNRAVSRLRSRDWDRSDRAEEQILRSGEATPLERARLLAVLSQLAGIASRVCLLYPNQHPAFHAVCELRIMDAWAVFDPLANQSFLVTHHPYASAWEIMRRPAIADGHPEHGRKPTVDSSFYQTVGIANIAIED